jgi:hypothetical protein
MSKKQPTIATSSCEAEYKAIFSTTIGCIWLRKVLENLHLQIGDSTPIFSNSQSAIAITKNPVYHDRTNHIEV